MNEDLVKEYRAVNRYFREFVDQDVINKHHSQIKRFLQHFYMHMLVNKEEFDEDDRATILMQIEEKVIHDYLLELTLDRAKKAFNC